MKNIQTSTTTTHPRVSREIHAKPFLQKIVDTTISVNFVGYLHWFSIVITCGIALVCIFGPCLTFWHLCSKDKRTFPNMTSATWMEMWLLIRNGDSENFEELIRGMGKELLPWEKQCLTRIEQFEKTLLIRGLVKKPAGIRAESLESQ